MTSEQLMTNKQWLKDSGYHSKKGKWIIETISCFQKKIERKIKNNFEKTTLES